MKEIRFFLPFPLFSYLPVITLIGSAMEMIKNWTNRRIEPLSDIFIEKALRWVWPKPEPQLNLTIIRGSIKRIGLYCSIEDIFSSLWDLRWQWVLSSEDVYENAVRRRCRRCSTLHHHCVRPMHTNVNRTSRRAHTLPFSIPNSNCRFSYPCLSIGMMCCCHSYVSFLVACRDFRSLYRAPLIGRPQVSWILFLLWLTTHGSP